VTGREDYGKCSPELTGFVTDRLNLRKRSNISKVFTFIAAITFTRQYRI